MAKHQSLLSTEEVTQTALALQALQLAITMEDKNLIQAKIEALNETTRPFAERAMDEAVKGALKGNPSNLKIIFWNRLLINNHPLSLQS